MSKITNSFLKYVPNEEWICTSSRLPWLRLNLNVPYSGILKEADQMYEQAVLHRPDESFGHYQNSGWKSLTLYGESPEITENTSVLKSWTSIAQQCPCTVEFIKNNFEITSNTGRIRFMWLDPQGYILPHQDRVESGLFETNIAIGNPNDCKFRFLEYGTVPFETGTAFMVDISNRHFVVNNSDQIRTHIIVHSKLIPGIIRSSYEQNFYS
jgi:hypothetical protein